VRQGGKEGQGGMKKGKGDDDKGKDNIKESMREQSNEKRSAVNGDEYRNERINTGGGH
jgi:hypothetical protein